jgi:hypothetical protein
VFTARYGLGPYIKQIRFVFEELKAGSFLLMLLHEDCLMEMLFTLDLYQHPVGFCIKVLE